MPRGTNTVSKIHLFVDLPQPSTDEACRHSAVVVRVSSAGRHARPRPDHEDDRRHPEQSRRDERRLPQSVAAARYWPGTGADDRSSAEAGLCRLDKHPCSRPDDWIGARHRWVSVAFGFDAVNGIAVPGAK